MIPWRRRRAPLGALAAWLAGGTAAAPAAAQGFPEDPVVAVEARPAVVDLEVGERVRVELIALDSAGAVVEDALILASVVGAEAGWDRATSEVVGLAPGETTIEVRVRRATPGGPGFVDLSGAIVVRVRPLPVIRLEIAPPAGPVYAGTRMELAATAHSAAGVRHDATITWRSSDEEIAAVSPGGLLRLGRAGRAAVSAAADGATATLDLVVIENPIRELLVEPGFSEVPSGEAVRFSVRARDAAGTEVPTGTLEWALAAQPEGGAGAFLDDGIFVAYGPGRYVVSASAGAASAATEIRATPRAARRPITQVGRVAAEPGHELTDFIVFEGVDGRDYAYTGTYHGNAMHAFDVTDPSAPVLTDSVLVDGRRVNDVKVNADATLAVITSENASTRRNGITLLDLTEPAHPRILTHYTEQLTGGVHNTWIVGDLVYAVQYGTMDLHIIDVSDPSAPKTVGRWGIANDDRWLHDVTIQDGLAYLSYWNDGLYILDVGAGIRGGTPTAPALVSSYRYAYRLGSERYANTHHAIRAGNYVFVADEIFNCAECVNGPRGYVHVLDVSDLEHPREVAFYRVPEAGVHNLWAEDDLLYIGYYQGGLRVLDISGELRGDLYRQGREIGWFMTAPPGVGLPFTWGAQPYKGLIYAADSNTGLWIMRMEDPQGPLP